MLSFVSVMVAMLMLLSNEDKGRAESPTSPREKHRQRCSPIRDSPLPHLSLIDNFCAEIDAHGDFVRYIETLKV